MHKRNGRERIMGKRLLTAFLLLAMGAGCGGPSRQNLANAPAPVQADPRPLIDRIDTISAVQTPGGVILRATGIAAVQGAYEGALIPAPAGPGIRAFEFRAFPPPDPERVSTPRSREVTVALFLSDRALAGVTELKVSGATNAQAVRR